ncbi:MAG: hypothetical protein ACYC2H_00020 [Thermoplasmatota archaeon]
MKGLGTTVILVLNLLALAVTGQEIPATGAMDVVPEEVPVVFSATDAYSATVVDGCVPATSATEGFGFLWGASSEGMVTFKSARITAHGIAIPPPPVLPAVQDILDALQGGYCCVCFAYGASVDDGSCVEKESPCCCIYTSGGWPTRACKCHAGACEQ